MPLKFRWETEFKETEIGEIPKDWEVGKLGSFVDIVRGVSFSKEYASFKQFNNCIALLRASNIARDGSLRLEDLMYIPKEIVKEEQFIKELDIIMVASSGNKDLVGKFAQIKEIPFTSGLTFGAFNFCIRPQRIGKLFLKFLLSSEIIENQLEKAVDGTNINNLRISDLKNFKILFPPLPEQARIATVLSWFDDLIEVKKKQNEILEKTAMAIFKSWFIDFEPFKDEEFVYNEELGREIPKGWEVKRLGDVVKAFKGLSYKSSEKYQENIEGGYIFITLDNFIRGGGFKNEYSWIKSEKIKKSHFVKEGDLIIALTDMTHDAKIVGAPAIVNLPNGFDYGVISLDCMKLEPIVENLKYYLYMFLKYTQEDNSTFANGANVLHLMVNNFLVGKLLQIPPPPILQSFHSLVEPLFQKIILNQKQIMTLRKVRDTLLPLLIFGKLRVEEI